MLNLREKVTVVDVSARDGLQSLDRWVETNTKVRMLNRLTEARRPNFGHMEVRLTIDDPEAYTKSWTVTIPWVFMPDTELLDWVCENEKDFQHLVGK
jgi:isopropylmalate/homocitrate/citramalate synthase